MKFSESWLREWVDPHMSTDALVHELTMAGLEVDTVEPASGDFTKVVVGEVVGCDPHPDADKLSMCVVEVGSDDSLQIVCGAPNVHAGMKAPVAMIGARLPGGLKIRKTKLRGVESQGMLCSEKELGLGDGADGLMALDADAPVGADFRAWLDLDDVSIDIDLTPNRGDCFSVLGIARETAVLTNQSLDNPETDPVAPVTEASLPVIVEAPASCPRFCGRVVRGIDPDARSPQWLRERLRRSGLRPIHPVVDVTNYVMLELGQPLHGFDLDNLQRGIIVRHAHDGETLALLDGKEIELTPDMLVIADHGGARALAGIMGGETSGVGNATRNVFFEVAFFSPSAIAGRARRYGLHTDASLRFERGVDPEGQRRAIERATRLLIDIAGGEAGPVIEVASQQELPSRRPVPLRRSRLAGVLGVTLPDETVVGILTRLGMSTEPGEAGWSVTPPSWRFDICIEEDLIEEVARVHGYDDIPEVPGRGDMAFSPVTETRVPAFRARDVLIDRGYQEVVTYSFVDSELQTMLRPELQPIRLANPISSEMTDMRVSLWPGLLAVLRQNSSRQQDRLRIFEWGLRFFKQHNEIKQINAIGGVMSGAQLPEQWCANNASGDFFDVKGDVEALIRLTGAEEAFSFEPARHPTLHPGQSARLRRGEMEVGWIGALHPALVSRFELKQVPYLFEIDTELFLQSLVPEYAPISRFPAVRRDLAVLVREDISAETLTNLVRSTAGNLLREVVIFDVYQGQGVDSGLKSIALGLILQETSRTLTDDDVDGVISAVISRLERELEARIRD